jgi:hypothetical protein
VVVFTLEFSYLSDEGARELVRTGIGWLQSTFDLIDDSLCLLRAADSGTVMNTQSLPKAVQFWHGCVFEHRLLRVRHSTQELIGRGFLLRTTLDCNCCSGILDNHVRAIIVESAGQM